MKEGNCAICGEWGDLEPDHIKTRGSGGPDIESNIWYLHRNCHTKKHAKGLRWVIENYPHTEKLLLSKGWKLSYLQGRWKLLREDK